MNWQELLLLRVMRIIRALHIDKILFFEGSSHAFTDYFKGMNRIAAVREIFGENTDSVLQSLRVHFTWFGGYMSVNGTDGHLLVSTKYLKNGDRLDIYLDLIHELVHVKQFMDGKELFDNHYSYTERPTEVEAYRHAVKEARRLGMNDSRICRYLKTEWMSYNDLRRLANSLGVACPY